MATHFEGEGAIEQYFGGYKLQDGSPAINAGVPVYVPEFLYNFQGVGGKDAIKVTDFFGNPIGDQPDIGVFESNTPEDEVNLNVTSGTYMWKPMQFVKFQQIPQWKPSCQHSIQQQGTGKGNAGRARNFGTRIAQGGRYTACIQDW